MKPDKVVSLVCDTYGITLSEVCSRSQYRDVVTARQIIAWALRQYCQCSTPEIARMLGWESHTSASYASQRIDPVARSITALHAAQVAETQNLMQAFAPRSEPVPPEFAAKLVRISLGTAMVALGNRIMSGDAE